MKYKILLFGLVAALLTSCSTYKAGQTPDDVYYSPAREASSEKSYTQNTRRDRYEEYVSQEDDQYLRMKIRNRDRWSAIDDYDYWYDSRYVPYYSQNYFRNNWNNSYVWNNWNPGFYGGFNGIGYGLYAPNYWGVNRFGYGNGYYSGYGGRTQTYITKRPPSVSRPVLSGYNNRNNSNRLGNTILKAFSPNNSDNSYGNNNTYSNQNKTSTNTYSSPERVYTPSSPSSSSGSSSSGGGGVSRPARNGGN